MKKSFVLCVLISLSLAQSPPKPLQPNVFDIPGDNGRIVYLSWRHYSIVGGIKYEILRGESPEKLEPIATLQLKPPKSIIEKGKENDVSELGYYIWLLDPSAPVSPVGLEKLSPEQIDSLKKIGLEPQKVVRVEFGTPPYEIVSASPYHLCLGEYYKVTPSMETAKRPLSGTLPANLFAPFGISVGENQTIGFNASVTADEIAFVEKGTRIVSPKVENATFVAKYGKKIISVISENDERFTFKFDQLSYIDRNAEPSKELFYAVRLYQIDKPIKKIAKNSEPVPITLQDDPPVVPAAVSVVVDSISRKGVVNFYYSPEQMQFKDFYDNMTFRVFATSINDTDCQSGKLIAEVGAEWQVIPIEDVQEKSAIYIEVKDEGGATAKSKLIPIQWTTLSFPPLPDNIRAVDAKNDDGKKVVVLWEPAQLAVSYSIEDSKPQTQIIDISDRNLYVVPRADGDTIMQITDPEKVPPNAQKLLSISQLVPGGEKMLTIRYEMRTNFEHEASYSEFTLDGIKMRDKDNTGQVIFKGIKEGKYKLNGWIIKQNGFKLNLPETQIEMDIDATFEHSVDFETSPFTYLLYRGTNPEDLSQFKLVGMGSLDDKQIEDVFPDIKSTKNDFYYIMLVAGPDGAVTMSKPIGPITPKGNIFHTRKTPIFLGTAIFVIAALYFVYHAKKGKMFYVRPIAGIVHIDEALGRATEMGKPVLYTAGLGAIEYLATLSSLTILGRVGKKIAEYQSRIIVPCYDPIVMIVSQETVRNAFINAGRPDLYREEDIYYIAAAQFAFAAAVSGVMVREKTAANFFIGTFAAESLILAETGASTGAIQVAGTDDMTQLPFFITACDYTLIGEELYAASAYLSDDLMQKGSLKAQDFLKGIEMALLILGTILATASQWWFTNLFRGIIEQ